MKLKEVMIGTKIEIEIYNEDGDKLTQPYLVSQLEEVFGDEEALIAAPIYKGEIFPLRINSVVDIVFSIKSDLYAFKAKVCDRTRSEKIVTLQIKKISEIKKIQRRQFFRLELTVPVRFKIDEQYKNAFTRDLSGGGVCLLTADTLELGSIAEFELTTSENRKIRFFGKIVRAQKNSLGDTSKYEIGVMFNKIEDKDRECIISFLFEEQRRLRKKGLI